MVPEKIKMISGPFAGNIYQRYNGEKEIINSLRFCVPVELNPGDYYRGIFELKRSPGCMPLKYLQENPAIWVAVD